MSVKYEIGPPDRNGRRQVTAEISGLRFIAVLDPPVIVIRPAEAHSARIEDTEGQGVPWTSERHKIFDTALRSLLDLVNKPLTR